MKALALAVTPRQRRFAEEYIIDYNASAACIRAGYSPNRANQQAHMLLHHEGVQALVDDMSRNREQKLTAADPDYVIQRVMKIMEKDGTRDGDVLRGAELLARILGMLKEKTEISGPDGGPIEMEARKVEQEAKDVIDVLRVIGERGKPDLKLVSNEA